MSDLASERTGSVPAEARRGFRFDLNECTGCNACELACSTENELGWGRSWRQVLTYNRERRPGLPTFHLSLACNHCAEAPCMRHCPALAIRRDPVSGAVLIDPELCVGCTYCAWACPYDAPIFDSTTRVMTKCTFCNHRLLEGRDPACVELCPTAALEFGDLAGEELVPGFPPTPARPAIRFEPLRPGRRPPETTWTMPPSILEAFTRARTRAAPKISLHSEWPLLVFSLIAAWLAGWSLGALGGGVDALPFLTLAGIALGTSTVHLGQKRRAWRAVLNLRGSWLSREIMSFGAFVTAVLVQLGWREGPAWIGSVAAGLGLSTVFAIDRVYDLVRPARARPLHSADTLSTALLVGALLHGWTVGVAVIAALKLFLYARRGFGRRPWGRGLSAIAIVLRVGYGLIIPLGAVAFQPLGWLGWALAGIAAGEFIDRAEFYSDLEVTSPRSEMDSIDDADAAALDLRKTRSAGG